MIMVSCCSAHADVLQLRLYAIFGLLLGFLLLQLPDRLSDELLDVRNVLEF